MTYELKDIVMKFTGPVRPVGDSSIDEVRLANLEALCELVDNLTDEIDKVACEKQSTLGSVRKAGHFADAFLTKLGIGE